MLSKDEQIYILTWVGTIAGVLGLVAGIIAISHPDKFPVSPATVALIAIVLTVLGLLARYIGREISRPDMETVQIVKRLDIEKIDGSEAKVTRIQKDKANRNVLQQTLFVGGIAASTAKPDDLYDFRIDGEPVLDYEKVWDINSWRISRTSNKPLEKGKLVTRELSFWVRNGFTNPKHEDFSHIVGNKLKSLKFEINLPKAPNNPKGYILYGQQP